MASRWAMTATRWALAVAMMGFGGNASATLLDRGPDMVYDDVLDITWTRNASLPGSAGPLQWTVATSFAAALNFGGFDDWRLPWASVAAGATAINTLPSGQPCTGAGGADEVACRDNEMAYMFYYNLDGNLFDNKSGTQTAVGGQQLTGIQLSYWSGTSFLEDSGSSIFRAYLFVFFSGNQFIDEKDTQQLHAWAVRDGDVCSQRPELCDASAVPEPGSLLVLGLGALGLGLIRRRGRAAALILLSFG